MHACRYRACSDVTAVFHFHFCGLISISLGWLLVTALVIAVKPKNSPFSLSWRLPVWSSAAVALAPKCFLCSLSLSLSPPTCYPDYYHSIKILQKLAWNLLLSCRTLGRVVSTRKEMNKHCLAASLCWFYPHLNRVKITRQAAVNTEDMSLFFLSATNLNLLECQANLPRVYRWLNVLGIFSLSDMLCRWLELHIKFLDRKIKQHLSYVQTCMYVFLKNLTF